MPARSKLKNKLSKSFLTLHKLGLKFGLQIIPDNPYSQVANIQKLKGTMDVWAKKSELPGIETSINEQLNILKETCLPYIEEYKNNAVYEEAIKYFGYREYGPIEAQALHSIIRRYQPKRIIEVGSGISTYCTLKALSLNKQEAFITCIEPHPSSKLKTLNGINLIQKEVQTIPAQEFMQLEKNDLLFIDSSHTVKPGSDVNYEILEILPRLQSGVIVHFHDIYLPFDYQRSLFTTLWQWQETSLLHAYLINNHKAKVLFCLSMLHYDCPEALKKIFPNYNPQKDKISGLNYGVDNLDKFETHFPASIYFKIT